MPYCTGCCQGTGPGPCTSGIPRRRRGARRPRTRCRAALPIDGAVGAAGIDRDGLLDDGLAQVVAHLLVRLRHLAGSAAVLAASNSLRAARRHHPASTVMIVASIAWRSPGGIFRYSALRFISAPPPMAQPARRLRSKVAHCRSPSFSITTTKRIDLQCQISTKTRSLLYPDIKPEPGGEQLLYYVEIKGRGEFPAPR